MTSVKNLQKIVRRAKSLAPVAYTIEIPGDLAIKLNYLAIKEGRSVEEEIISAIDDHTTFLDYE